jgi:uncharacterized protein (TIGR02284 family)
MKMSSDNAIRVLNELTAVGRDAERGFQTAAVQVKDPVLVRFFAEKAAERAKLVHELQERTKALRAEPDTDGTLAGTAHRKLMELETALASNTPHAILAECERGEDLATHVYAQALKERDLDEQTLKLIQRQYELVQVSHDRIRQLRDSEQYAHR